MTPAERHLRELRITEPSEIDLEAIAFHLGARVRYRPLDGCDARIIGSHGAVLITVNAGGSRRRQRFSIAHELGHWCYHRGKVLVCRAEDYRPRDWSLPECIADGYAADLLMPRYLFDSATRQQPKLNFTVVNDLADLFDTSLTATAIRLVESDQFTALLVCHSVRPYVRSCG